MHPSTRHEKERFLLIHTEETDKLSVPAFAEMKTGKKQRQNGKRRKGKRGLVVMRQPQLFGATNKLSLAAFMGIREYGFNHFAPVVKIMRDFSELLTL